MKRMRLSPFLSLTTIAICCFLSGCGDKKPVDTGPPRIPVSGKVTLDGKPLENGTISFEPKAEGLRPTGGPIENGTYNVPQEKGGNAGLYLVKISWLKPTGEKVANPDAGGGVKEVIPQKYNVASTLEETLSPEKHEFNFDLKSK